MHWYPPHPNHTNTRKHLGCLSTLAWDIWIHCQASDHLSSSPNLNFKSCVYAGPVYILQKRLNMDPELDGFFFLCRGTNLKWQRAALKGLSEACMLNRYAASPACLAVFNVTFESPKSRADQGKGPQRALWAAEHLFPTLTSVSFSRRASCSTYILASVRWHQAQECTPPKGNTDPGVPSS